MEYIVDNILVGTTTILIIIIVVYVRGSRVDHGPWENFKRSIRITYFNRRKDPNNVVIIKDKRRKR